MSRITVLGSGAWGTAIALSLYRRAGHQVSLWAHSPELAQQIADARENTQFLPGIPLPADLAVTADRSWDAGHQADEACLVHWTSASVSSSVKSWSMMILLASVKAAAWSW